MPSHTNTHISGNGAQDRRDGQLDIGAVRFGSQERVVECGIVGDQDAAAQ